MKMRLTRIYLATTALLLSLFMSCCKARIIIIIKNNIFIFFIIWFLLKDASGNYLDPYQRAKTVRIGKWRWPPPKGEEETSDSFLHFKLKQSSKKSSKGDGKVRIKVYNGILFVNALM